MDRPFAPRDMKWPVSIWGYGLDAFHLGIWCGPFPIGDVDWLLFGWAYALALFQLGIWTGPFRLRIRTGPFQVADMDWPLSTWGYGLVPLQVGIGIGHFLVGNMTSPFLVGDVDWLLSNLGDGVAPFQLGMCTSPLGIWQGLFRIGRMDWPFSGWRYGSPLSASGYEVAHFRLGIWTGRFPLGDMDWPLSNWGYEQAPFQLWTFIGSRWGGGGAEVLRLDQIMSPGCGRNGKSGTTRVFVLKDS